MCDFSLVYLDWKHYFFDRYDRYVSTPLDKDFIVEHMHDFKIAGITGAWGFSHATHVIHEMARSRLRR